MVTGICANTFQQIPSDQCLNVPPPVFRFPPQIPPGLLPPPLGRIYGDELSVIPLSSRNAFLFSNRSVFFFRRRKLTSTHLGPPPPFPPHIPRRLLSVNSSLSFFEDGPERSPNFPGEGGHPCAPPAPVVSCLDIYIVTIRLLLFDFLFFYPWRGIIP